MPWLRWSLWGLLVVICGCTQPPVKTEQKSEPKRQVEVRGVQLFVNGQAQEQLYGAEVQYFRLRGGQGRNLPRAKVLELWTRALDRVVEAKMNTVSFYIPWDFHEYAEGKFDFTGTADDDGDGQPDYPSRDLVTFIKMIEERGIKRIMARPGPYINAEWGFLGFGAIPLWLHEKFPQAHMQGPDGKYTRNYDYHNPDFLRLTQLWFKKLFNDVLAKHIGPGRSIIFLQLDNETNFMWQSIYNHDYSPSATARYQTFLQNRYGTIAKLNGQHQRSWAKWTDITPPKQAGVNVAEDQDWYRFQDQSIYEFLVKIRGYWEALGIQEPTVMFTLAESYNATKNGLIPNYRLRNMPGKTGLLTVNLYPKTAETEEHPLFNNPFKSDHDVEAANAASEFYLGNGRHWVMGPEIQGGWWKGIEVSPEARLQTYLSVIGHGLKGLLVYYLHEGDQWMPFWAKSKIEPYYQDLRAQPRYRNVAENKLPKEFWQELQKVVDQKVAFGFDAFRVYQGDNVFTDKLFFDAPLDAEAKPRGHFAQLKMIGEKIIAPHGAWLGQAVSVTEPVCIVKDVAQHVPSEAMGMDNVIINTDWSAGLVGYLLHAGINPQIIHWGMTPKERLDSCRLIFHHDNGITSEGLVPALKSALDQGAIVVNFFDDSLARDLGLTIKKMRFFSKNKIEMSFESAKFKVPTQPIASYDLLSETRCVGTFFSRPNGVHGYRCPVGKGHFIQVSTVFHDIFNANTYTQTADIPQRLQFIRSLLKELKLIPAVQVAGRAARVVAFARHIEGQPEMWITTKSGHAEPTESKIIVRDVQDAKNYRVQNVLSGEEQTLNGLTLRTTGFTNRLNRYGSTVFWLTPAGEAGAKP